MELLDDDIAASVGCGGASRTLFIQGMNLMLEPFQSTPPRNTNPTMPDSESKPAAQIRADMSRDTLNRKSESPPAITVKWGRIKKWAERLWARKACLALLLLLGGCDYVATQAMTWEYVWRHWTRPEPATTFDPPTKLPPVSASR